MARKYIRIILGSLLLLMPLLSIGQADSADVSRPAAWIGLEVPGIIIQAVNGGYAFQPMSMLSISRYWGVWAGAGIMSYRYDTLFNSLYQYQSNGWYAKAGADFYLPFRPEGQTGFRFGAGLVYSAYREKGEVRFGYQQSQFFPRIMAVFIRKGW
jgi:hypothetical protein